MTTKITLNNGRTLDKDFLDRVKCAVERRTELLPPDVKFTLKMICGEGFWTPLDHGERRTAGMCMVHLVETGGLPLMFAETKHEYPKHYRIT